jgi:hypothetical protein
MTYDDDEDPDAYAKKRDAELEYDNDIYCEPEYENHCKWFCKEEVIKDIEIESWEDQHGIEVTSVDRMKEILRANWPEYEPGYTEEEIWRAWLAGIDHIKDHSAPDFQEFITKLKQVAEE